MYRFKKTIVVAWLHSLLIITVTHKAVQVSNDNIAIWKKDNIIIIKVYWTILNKSDNLSTYEKDCAECLFLMYHLILYKESDMESY